MRMRSRLLVVSSAVLSILWLAAPAPCGGESLKSYGQATPGTGQKSPRLWVTTTPRVGENSFGLTVRDGKAGAVAFGFFSLQKASLNLAGVAVNIDFALSLPLPPAALGATGSLSYATGIPNIPALIGARVYAQVFVADTGSPAALGFSGTRGLEIKVSNTALLLVSRAVGGTQDDQVAIDLKTGTVHNFGRLQVDNGKNVDYLAGCTHAVIAAGLSRNISLFDAQVTPPTYVKSFAAQGIPWSMTLNPDGIRLYIVNQGSAGMAPEVQVVWAIAGASNFGTAFAGTVIKLGSILDAMKMEFTPNGQTGFLGTLGLFGGGAELRKYDTALGSPTYHVAQKVLKFQGYFMFDFLLLPDGYRLCLPMAPLGNNATMPMYNMLTMTEIDVDPKAPGIQAFGGEVSWARTPLTRVVGSLVADPEGKYLYLANTSNVLRIIVDLQDPAYPEVKTITIATPSSNPNMRLAISDAGDRLYVATGSRINEYDAKTLVMLRQFVVSGARSMAYR